ncbi:glutathione S-transferase family protein [Spirulina sp. 06S082]|uniref:glutathione S-transferase family protein n=1 Tax=Spirulina sp. 06S082 TaxID=3110248 RepID=UPI002B205F3A|nr:glutathione S-transferase family protein [Spirulina sp. 06S082]MEA5471890.1 glutathione S-transferase family protein [Spirulina sp. 06S082]
MAELTLVIGNKNYSSWSLRPWLAMKQADLDFSEIRIPLDTPNTHREIRYYSPSGRVPVLLHDNLTIWESWAICEYIVENFAPQLLPGDRQARAFARSVSLEMHAGFYHLRQKMPMDCRNRFPGEGMNPDVHTDITRVKEIWYNCRHQFGENGPFLFGEFSLADAMFAPVVSRFITYDVPLTDSEKAYTETIWQLPAMQEWLNAASQEVEIISHP